MYSGTDYCLTGPKRPNLNVLLLGISLTAFPIVAFAKETVITPVKVSTQPVAPAVLTPIITPPSATSEMPSIVNTSTSTPALPSKTPSTATTIDTQLTAAEKQKMILDFLKNAAAYIKENGKESSLAEFNKKNGIFTKDSLYVFAVSYDGGILATQDYDQKILGTNQLNFKDADGVNVIQGFIEKAKSGGGWLLYKTENPTNKTLQCKNSYVMPANVSGNSDYLIGAGYYYPISSKTGKCE